MLLRRCFKPDLVARPGSASVTLWGMAHPGGQLLAAGGSLGQESAQASRAWVCFVGHRCMRVLLWVRSVLLKQVRSLSPLPADVRALPSTRAAFVLGAAKAEDVSTWEYPFSQQDQSGSS